MNAADTAIGEVLFLETIASDECSNFGEGLEGYAVGA